MKTSDSIIKIAPALVKAQSQMSFASKNSKNPHFKNTYADLPSVIDAVKDALNSNGIVFLQTPTDSEDGRLHLVTRLIHESGEWIEDVAVCPLPKSDPQGFGSALTYMRRYNLASICGLYQEDDDGEKAKAVENNNVFVDVAVLNKTFIDITMAKDEDTLRTLYLNAVRQFTNNPSALKSLEMAKDKRKKELNNV